MLEFLTTLLENVEKDIKNLSGTPFAQLPVGAKKANLKIKELTDNYIQNTESVMATQAEIFNQIAGVDGDKSQCGKGKDLGGGGKGSGRQ